MADGRARAPRQAVVVDERPLSDAGGERAAPRVPGKWFYASELMARARRLERHPDVCFGLKTGALAFAFLILLGVVWPTPASVLVVGAILGALSALVGMGIVLIYRANRIINFAQGDMGAVAAVLAVSLIAGRGMGFWPATLIGLLAAIATGALVDLLVVRRFRRAPRLLLTVATLGVAAIMQGLQLWIPTRFGYDIAPQDFPHPFPFTLDWDPVIFRGGHLLVLVLVPALGFGLAAFLRRTRLGQAVRATAESADRALTLGIPVSHLNTLVWVMAAALSALASLLRAPIVGIPIGTVLGPSLLLRALAAAVIGRMENLAVTFFAAVGLAMIEQAVLWDTGRTLFADAVLFFVVLAALLLQRRGEVSRALERATATWTNIREVRPVPPELRRLPEVRAGRALVLVGVVAALIVVPLQLGPGRVNLLAFGVLTAMLGLSLVVLTGWSGEISLGQWAFAGFGAAVAGALALEGWHMFAALAVGSLAGAGVSIVLGIPALRIRGPFLAVVTLAFGLASWSYFLNREFFGYVPSDERIPRPVLFGKFDLESEYAFYFFVLVVFALVTLSLRSLRASRTGRALIATRENEQGAQAFGLNLVRTRLTSFALAGFLAALAGAVLVFHQETMFQSPLRPENSLRLFSIVVVGGLGSVPGVVLGAAFFTFFDFFVNVAELQLITSGAGLLLVLLLVPGGLGQLLYSARDRLLRLVAARRGLVVPSLVADLRVDEEGRPVAGDALPRPTLRTRTAARWGPRLVRRRRHHASDTDGALLEVSDLDVAYGPVQVLFGVDLRVRDGELLALLGTNGAGKSTLLATIAGLLEPRAGRITLGGEDITGTPANRVAARGVVLVPGGRGVFPTLTVEENLRLAGWIYQREPGYVDGAIERVLEFFPILRERWHQKAGDLSGGEQQMLTLGQALIARPRLLMIDELSLGLAPILVEQLLDVVREIHRRGTAVILVEQSVNVAVTVAERAVFMEKGEVRFDGPVAELLKRPDLLRAVFLGEAARRVDGQRAGSRRPPARVRERERTTGDGAARGPVLEVDDLVVTFGGVRAVDGVSLSVGEGEIVGVIGPNGAGKTAMFDAISGYVPTRAGRVVLGGTDVSALSPDRRAVLGLGRSFQDARLFPALTVSENLALALERHIPTRDPLAAALGSPATRMAERFVAERVEELIELMHLHAYANKYVSELSTGTRRVVDLACSLAHEPSVALLDEPSSGIAQRETEALAPLLLEIRERTRAGLVVIEHDIPLVSAVSDRMVALDLGRVIAEGPPGKVVRDRRVVESYLGESEEAIRRSGQRARTRRGTRRGRAARTPSARRRPLVAAGR